MKGRKEKGTQAKEKEERNAKGGRKETGRTMIKRKRRKGGRRR